MIVRRLLGFQQSLPSAAVDLLLSESAGDNYDLSSCLVLAPTAEAVRTLRKRLAITAGKNGRGVLSPMLLTPGQALEALAGRTASIASSLTSVAAWTRALQNTSPDKLEILLPANQGLDERQYLDLAFSLMQLRMEISEGGHDFSTARRSIPAMDQDRWSLLADLEKEYRSLLSRYGWVDKEDHIASFLQNPMATCKRFRVFLVGAPDFPNRLAQLLDAISKEVSITILIAAEETDDHLFDSYGRPRPEAFDNFTIPLAEENLHSCPDAGEAIGKAASMVAEKVSPPWPCAFGVGNTATAPVIENRLLSKDIQSFDPGGRPFSETEIGQCLMLFHRIMQSGESKDFTSLLQNPIFLLWMKSQHPGKNPSSWIGEMDHYLWKHIPSDMDSLFAILSSESLSAPFRTLEKLYRDIRTKSTFFELLQLPQLTSLMDLTSDTNNGLTDFLEKLYEEREKYETLLDRSLSTAVVSFLLEQCSRFSVYNEVQSPNEIAIYGWLELLWSEVPWLLVVDLLEGTIPSPPDPNPFLNESLRRQMGLAHVEQRTARDAYILFALLEFRKRKGRVDVFTSRKDMEGRDALPSRLLYFVEDEQLPIRIKNLSSTETASGNPTMAKNFFLEPTLSGRAWLYQRKKIPVTYFASWLRCPFTFYLEKVCTLEDRSTDKLEMDAADYGTALHEVLKAVDEEASIKESTSAESITGYALDFLQDWMTRRYGKEPNVFLSLQKDSLRQRLRKTCEVKAMDRQEGWQPLRVEWDFSEEYTLLVQGIPLTGRIDLVEINEKGDRLRITDYKTGKKPVQPLDAHWIKSGRGSKFRLDSLFPVSQVDGRCWANLQLPLYALAISKAYPQATIELDYFTIPQSLTEIKRHSWEGYSPSVGEEAAQVAEKIMDYWMKNAFWPPSNGFSRSTYAAMCGPAGLRTWNSEAFFDLSQ